MSEAFINSALLALSGGFQDAYTYNTRDKVFSNAQTGNIVLMSQYFMVGEWRTALHYLFPLLSFVLGVLIAEQIQNRFKEAKRLHWRQGILLAEILILFLVGFLPQELNIVATALVSFTCAMQVQAFRKMRGYSYASTMCIGNLRSGTDALSIYLREKKRDSLKQALYYYGIILLFAIGAGIGGNLSARFGISMIWISCICLLLSFLLMSLEKLK
ncbi:MAG: YoaK family protein [Lachnospiraceae bacterium]